MVYLALRVGNQSFFHATVAILIHCLTIRVLRVVALTVTRNQSINLSFLNRFSGLPALLRLRRTKLLFSLLPPLRMKLE